MSSLQHLVDLGSPTKIAPITKRVIHLFAQAGIEIGGSRPWDLQVHDDRFYPRLLAGGSLAAGESFVDGWWDAPALDELFTRVHRANIQGYLPHWHDFFLAAKEKFLNCQLPSRAARAAHQHYDLGNDVYQAMLDPWMQYTCGYWKDATNLNQAQEHKLHLICRKMHLQPGMTVIDLGGGFGGLARFLASAYHCRVVVYNISAEQIAFGRDWCAGLPVRFELRDYREAVYEPEPFDRVLAIGLCEHIGAKNYRSFLELAARLLKPRGLFLLHSIGSNASFTYTDAWMDRYIFPNGSVPSIAQLGSAAEGLWVMEDWHNFGPDYDQTLMAWWRNFDRAWPQLEPIYGARFYRMWKYYLLACAGSFRARQLQLWQIVFSKGDVPAYLPVR
jgi:cyclopropane-fatty-acyl-phospholipid synthase